MKKRIIVIAFVIVSVAGIGFVLASNKKKINENNTVKDRSGIPVAVSVVKAFNAAAGNTFTLPAVIEAHKEADITVNAQGKLTSLNIELGSLVKKGQVIGSTDTKLKELNLQATELSVNKLEKDYLRYKELYEGKAATEVAYNESKFNYENAKIQAEQIRQQITDGKVIAPLSGVIVKKNMEEGEFVNPGSIIASVVDHSSLKANVMVNEKDVYRLQVGMLVNIRCDVFPGKNVEGKISFISPKGDESHSYQVELIIKNNDLQLKPGTFIRADFNIQSGAEVLQIPKIALAEGIKNPYVYIIENGKAVSRKIVIGREIGENIEVISGINEGDPVIVSGQINLTEGSLVETIENK